MHKLLCTNFCKYYVGKRFFVFAEDVCTLWNILKVFKSSKIGLYILFFVIIFIVFCHVQKNQIIWMGDCPCHPLVSPCTPLSPSQITMMMITHAFLFCCKIVTWEDSVSLNLQKCHCFFCLGKKIINLIVDKIREAFANVNRNQFIMWNVVSASILFFSLWGLYFALFCGINYYVLAILVHSQVTIIFAVSVGLFVCLCRVFLSRLWSDFDQTWTYVICLGLVVSPRI